MDAACKVGVRRRAGARTGVGMCLIPNGRLRWFVVMMNGVGCNASAAPPRSRRARPVLFPVMPLQNGVRGSPRSSTLPVAVDVVPADLPVREKRLKRYR